MINYRRAMRKDGADERTRTADLLITNQLLYQLSYVGPRGPAQSLAGPAPKTPLR